MKMHYQIKIEHKSEHEIIQIVYEKKLYTEPKLYIPKQTVNGKRKPTVAKGKRWYVYFRYYNRETGNVDIRKQYYRNINRFDTVAERTAIGKALLKAYSMALENGWNPLTKHVEEKEASHTLKSALKYALEIKCRDVKESTQTDYSHRLDMFFDWSDKNYMSGKPLEKFQLNDFYQFLDYLQLEYVNKKTGKSISNTSIDNTKRVISALFTELKNKRLIEYNFIKDIPKIKSKPVKNRPFSHSEIKEIKSYLEKNDPYLIYFISFMIYPLLRPREITRLKIRDLNTKDWILGVETKTEDFSYSRIINKMKPVIDSMNIAGLPGDFSLFTYENKPGVWQPEKLSSKVTYFSNRFKKVKKALGFGPEYGLYSFRHSAIGDLYNGLQKSGLSEREVLYKLMPITGHKSEAGLKNYLRNIKIALPPDHSEIYSLEF